MGCPPELTKICYRYEGEDWICVDGNDYSIIKEQGQCPIFYNVDVYTEFSSPYYEPRRVTASGYGRIKGLFHDTNNSRQTWVLYLRFGTTDNPDGVRDVIVSGTGSRTLKHENYKITNISPADPSQEDNCGSCVLSVTKNGRTVHTETRSVCPEIKIYCDNDCPPWSCKCVQGNRVCCYDPNGRVVKTFLLESP